MKKLLRLFFYLAILLVVIIAGGFTYLTLKFPADIPATDLKVEVTGERIARGKYLATNVSMCIDCHSDRDFTKFSGPLVEGTTGKGGQAFTSSNADIPGTIYSRNITPFNLSRYSDGELLRVITTGINKEGKALFPLMPYMHYGQMAKEDIYSIIAYLRSLPPIQNSIPERSLDFPMSLIVNTIPVEANLAETIPSKQDTLAYGKYMINAASCSECHSQRIKGELVEGMENAGGRKFMLPSGDEVYSANITPDMETGLGALSLENFISRFKSYDNEQSKHIPVKEHEKNTVMPWTQYAGMTEEDLTAIYKYLRTVPPVKNKVEIFRPSRIQL